MKKFLLVLSLIVFSFSFASAQGNFGYKSKYKIPIGNGNGGLNAIDTGVTGQVLTSNGNAAPTWKPTPQRIFFTGGGANNKFYSLVPNGSTTSGSNADFTDTTANFSCVGAWCAPVAGKFKNLHIFSLAPQGAASVTVTLIKTTAVTALTTTNSGATASSTDITHTITAAVNDLFCIKCTVSGSPANNGFCGWVEFYPN